MDRDKVLEDLEIIKNTMEAAGRYSNVPGESYVSAAAAALGGSALTWYVAVPALWWYMGGAALAGPSMLPPSLLLRLGVIWALVFVVSLLASVLFARRNARKEGKKAWDPLVKRMVMSQLPLLAAGAILTLVLALSGNVALIPGWWLWCYGLVLFSLHFFTGKDHLVQSAIFFALGTAAFFVSVLPALALLAAGFGGVHLVFGLRYLVKQRRKIAA